MGRRVGNFVAAKAFKFNTIQQSARCKLLILKGMLKLEKVVPNQVKALTETH